MTELYFSTVKILAQTPTHISVVATVLLITTAFTVKYYNRRLQTNIASIIIIVTGRERERDRNVGRERGREREREGGRE